LVAGKLDEISVGQVLDAVQQIARE
jgi:hypothetical protein